jgi:uncharacterized circularly permuted ATP-grasp superfamily protein
MHVDCGARQLGNRTSEQTHTDVFHTNEILGSWCMPPLLVHALTQFMPRTFGFSDQDATACILCVVCVRLQVSSDGCCMASIQLLPGQCG